jgi:hypothetical protein
LPSNPDPISISGSVAIPKVYAREASDVYETEPIRCFRVELICYRSQNSIGGGDTSAAFIGSNNSGPLPFNGFTFQAFMPSAG